VIFLIDFLDNFGLTIGEKPIFLKKKKKEIVALPSAVIHMADQIKKIKMRPLLKDPFKFETSPFG
jgi:hypothetical protein